MLEKLLGSQARAALIEALFDKGHRKVHLRELARLTGVAAPNLLRVARDFVTEGIVKEERDGNRVLYSANAHSPLYAALCDLVEKTSSGESLLRSALAKGAAKASFIYGSRAKGMARADSDYDVLVITDEGLRNVVGQLGIVHEKLGVEVNPYVLTPTEFSRRMREGDHFLCEVMAGKKIFLRGDEYELAAMAR